MSECSWDQIFDSVSTLGDLLTQRKLTLATAESCTGGGIAYALTHVSGASNWYLGGVSAYANSSKERLLGVAPLALEQQGAVSEQVVAEMAAGACQQFGTQLGLSSSGVAGPGGGSPQKPVGTVCLGWSIQGQLSTETYYFKGDREQVRVQAIQQSIKNLLARL